MRGHVDDVAGLDPEQEEVRVAAQLAELLGDDPATVRRDLARRAPTAELEAPLLACLQPPHDDVEVEAVAPVRGVREQRAVAGDMRRPVDEARIHDQPGSPVEKSWPRSFPPSSISSRRRSSGSNCPLDRLVEARQLLELTALHRQRGTAAASPDRSHATSSQEPSLDHDSGYACRSSRSCRSELGSDFGEAGDDLVAERLQRLLLPVGHEVDVELVDADGCEFLQLRLRSAPRCRGRRSGRRSRRSRTRRASRRRASARCSRRTCAPAT